MEDEFLKASARLFHTVILVFKISPYRLEADGGGEEKTAKLF